jgi:hypothetical protein
MNCMKRYLLLAAAAAVFASGCAKESSRPVPTGEGSVRAINAISTAPNFGFLIEERFIDTLPYKVSTSATSWDDLDYTFNFDVLLTGATAQTRVASQFIDVEKDRDYTMVLTGAVESPDITVWETDIREWEDGETGHEVRFANVSTSLGPVDVYFEAPGTAPVIGNRLGTVGFTEILPAVEFEAGERSLILTAVDDPGTILYESVSLTLLERNSYIVSPFDADANDLGSVSVLLINAQLGGGGSIADVSTQSTARFFHASRDMGNVDIFTDDPLTVPQVSNQAFGEYTDDLPIMSGDTPITYTAAGNMGSILIDEDRLFRIGAHHSLFAIRGADGIDVLSNFVLDRRSIETQTKLTLINTSIDNPSVDVYLLREGETVEETFPLIPILTTFAPPFVAPIRPNQYDLYLTAPFEKTILFGPVPLDGQAGDVVEGIVYDTADPTVPSLEFIPLP